MIHRLVDLSLKYRGLVLAIYLGLAVAGYGALRASAIDALPDLSDNQVIVFTEWAGHSAQEVEDQVTYPLTVNLQGLAGVRVVRSQSAFGFSMIYAVFDDDVDLYPRPRPCPRATRPGDQDPAFRSRAHARSGRDGRGAHILVNA